MINAELKQRGRALEIPEVCAQPGQELRGATFSANHGRVVGCGEEGSSSSAG